MHDVLVIGGGIAGLRAAVAAKRAGASVALATQSHPARSYSVAIQDGINAGGESEESQRSHAADTLAAGAGINDASVVEQLCREAPGLVAELDRMGAPFNRQGTDIDRVQLPDASEARTCYIDDSTGLALTQTLYEQAIGAGIDMYVEWVVTSLVVEDGRCRGAVAMELASGKLETLSASAVVLATGGPRRAFEPSTASLQCSGSGIALAYRAGVGLIDMEFVQYYPAVLKGRKLALTPLLWARGASSDDGGVTLSGSPDASEAEARFPDTLHRVKALSGVDLLKDAAPVAPAMSRLLGGIAVDIDGATSMPGLFAAGECAGNGFHGASGLDGNFLLASVATGKRAGESAAREAKSGGGAEPGGETLGREEGAIADALGRPGGAPVAALRQELATLMHEKAGMSRNADGLAEALQRIGAMRTECAALGAGAGARDYNFGLVQYLELSWLLDASETIVASAIERTESRGAHARSDYPALDEAQAARVSVTRADSGPQMSRQSVAAS